MAKTKINTRLRILLAERNMKQYELAEKAGISTVTVSAVARDQWDRISRDIMHAICEALDCQPGDLFVRE
jgi:putative transcriptional regulator